MIDILENKQYHKFSKNPYKGYNWFTSTNYKDNEFCYDRSFKKNIIKKYDPEINGNGTCKIFSKIESSVNNVTQICETGYDIVDHNKKIDYGLHLIARFLIPKLLDDNDYEIPDFKTSFDALKEECSLYFSKQDIIALNKNYSYKRIFTGIIRYSKKYLIISDTPIIYVDNSFMCYPLSADTLFVSGICGNDMAEGNLQAIKNSIYNWIDFICRKSNLYLIGHDDLSIDIKDCIQHLYENEIYTFSIK